MRFCNTHRAAASKIITGDCCQTNNFGYYNEVDFQSGKLTKIDGNVMNTQTNKLDDGGEQLGECEGFEIAGSEVFATGMKIFILQKAKGATFVNDLSSCLIVTQANFNRYVLMSHESPTPTQYDIFGRMAAFWLV